MNRKRKAPSFEERGSGIKGYESSFDVRCSMFDVRRLVLLFFLGGLWTLDFGLWTFSAQSTNASRLDYSLFRVVADRNIFNPRRSPRYVPSERTRRTYTRADSFGLVGTMNYEKGLFAFFDGSSPDYRKVLKQDDTIAGFKVAAIEPSYVKLASPTNQVELHVGMQLRHGDDGEWQVSALPESLTPASVPGNSSGASRPLAQNEAPGTNTSGNEATAPGPDQLPLDAVELQQPPPGAEPAAASSGGESDVLERMRRRAAAERGENP